MSITKKEFFDILDQTKTDLARERSEALAIADFSPKDRKDRLEKAEKDTLYFAATYLPHYATSKPSKLHRNTAKELERPGMKLILWPRGFGKTTFCSRIDVLRKILFGQKKHIIIVSETENSAASIVASIRWELEDNPRIMADFGSQKSRIWGNGEFVTRAGVRVLARGYRQQIRGQSFRANRPDHIIIDDLESETSARNPRLVQGKIDWIERAVIPAMQPKSSMIIIGTILAKMSVIDRLASEPEYAQRFNISRHPAVETDAIGRRRSAWPARFPVDILDRMREDMGEHAWAAEMMHQPIDDSMIRANSFRRGDPDRPVITVGYVDPAMGGKRGDYTATLIVSVDAKKNVYIRHVRLRREPLRKTVQAVGELVEQWNPHIVGVESNGFQALVTEKLEEHILAPFVEVKNSEKKELRIMRFAGYVERGRVFLPPQSTKDEEEFIRQCVYFPSTVVHDDGPDAAAGAIDLATGRGRRRTRGIMA